jgi:excinuclease UvrABC nuclease subunit
MINCIEIKKETLNISGIYLLFKDKELVYIGKSKYVYSRLTSHIIESVKDFDEMFVIPCDEVELAKLEYTAINEFSPRLNKTSGGFKTHRLYSPDLLIKYFGSNE